MDLSIIIPEYKTTELTQQLLDNLKEATSWSYETEVIVVQDGDDYPYAKQVTDGPLVTAMVDLLPPQIRELSKLPGTMSLSSTMI
jgi:hypothetical protein